MYGYIFWSYKPPHSMPRAIKQWVVYQTIKYVQYDLWTALTDTTESALNSYFCKKRSNWSREYKIKEIWLFTLT